MEFNDNFWFGLEFFVFIEISIIKGIFKKNFDKLKKKEF
jgi:hypothetical protein